MSDTIDFRDEISTVDHDGKRKHIYAWQPQGKFYSLRTKLSYIYFLLFFGLPFIYVNGNPFIMFNIPESTFIIFGKVFTPEDFIIFGVLMLISLIAIVLFTVAFGRLFCGWMCPQTIFLEMLFRKIEFAIEGTAPQQKKLNEGPKDGNYYSKKILKHSIFILLSLLVSLTFLSYIIGAKGVVMVATDPVSMHVMGYLSLIGFTLIFYGVFAFMRELVCTVACPYGRLQSVLLDKDSIVVSYDYIRGEPRAKGLKDREDKGDCVDCSMCVRVCPTGIDIRNGTQLECVNCTACIDACDEVMRKVHLPEGLIRYASENGIKKGMPFRWTNRMKFYSIVLILLIGLLTYFISSKSDLDYTVIKVPGQIMQENSDGTVSNLYRLVINNKSREPKAFSLRLSDPKATIHWVIAPPDSLSGLSKNEYNFFVVKRASDISIRREKMKLIIMSGSHEESSVNIIFRGEY